VRNDLKDQWMIDGDKPIYRVINDLSLHVWNLLNKPHGSGANVQMHGDSVYSVYLVT
jgi:hypothetical protein